MLPHYAAVIRFVYDNRYATCEQVRRRFADQMRSSRTAQYQLARLVELGYLATAPVRSTSPNFPYVFSVTSAGVRYLREIYRDRGTVWVGSATERPRSGGMALQSLLHEVLLTEFDLMVWQTIRRRPVLQRLFVERRYFRKENRLRFDWHGQRLTIEPDSGFLLRQTLETSGTSGESNASSSPAVLLHLTELDNGTMSAARVAKKLRRYEAWSRSLESREYLESLHAPDGPLPRRPNFRLLVIAHDKDNPGGDLRRLSEIFSQVLELSSRLRRQIWLTTAERLGEVASLSAPLTAPIWWRAREADAWLAEFRQRTHALGRFGGRQRTRFVAERITQLPGHALFRPASDQQDAAISTRDLPATMA